MSDEFVSQAGINCAHDVKYPNDEGRLICQACGEDATPQDDGDS